MAMSPVPSKSLAQAIAYVRGGGRLVVPSYARTILIDAKVLARFEAAGEWLLKEEGEGYRLRQGRSSVYVLPGQLCYA
jgi:hypothetical protein